MYLESLIWSFTALSFIKLNRISGRGEMIQILKRHGLVSNDGNSSFETVFEPEHYCNSLTKQIPPYWEF